MFTLVLLLLSITFFGCKLLFPTTLTIENNTSYDLGLIQWNGIFFGDDQVYSACLGRNTHRLRPGSSAKMQVDPASDYITFWLISTTDPEYRTIEMVTVKHV